MNISARHLAATQYTMIAMFFVASWYVLLTPIDQARDMLESLFAPGAANREFFVWFAIANFFTVVVAVTFWFKRAVLFPLAPILVCISVGLCAWALWWSNTLFVLIYTLGCIFSIWSWRRPNSSLNQDEPLERP